MSKILDITVNQSAKENLIRDDQARLLDLACPTFRSIPSTTAGKCNMKKCFFYAQETIGHARGLTSENGCLRMKLFNTHDLSIEQKTSSHKIVQFIVHAHGPSFFEIYFNTSAIQGPKVVLNTRDFTKASTA